MPSNHLILCRPLLLPSSIFPSIRVFSNDFLFLYLIALKIVWFSSNFWWNLLYNLWNGSSHIQLCQINHHFIFTPRVPLLFYSVLGCFSSLGAIQLVSLSSLFHPPDNPLSLPSCARWMTRWFHSSFSIYSFILMEHILQYLLSNGTLEVNFLRQSRAALDENDWWCWTTPSLSFPPHPPLTATVTIAS